jgi:protein-tyrosine phosphatase
MRAMVESEGLSGKVIVDSCGTGSFHVGEPPDSRAVQAASMRDYDLSPLRARQIRPEDFDEFDYVLAMDRMNLGVIEAMKPDYYGGYAGLFLDFSNQRKYRQVPDPYYEGPEGFELVLNLVEDACRGLLGDIREKF